MHPRHHHLRQITSVLILASLYVSSLAGCSWPHRVAGIIHEDAGGAVYLEEVQNLEFQASHPIQVGQPAINRLLEGIRIEQPAGSSSPGQASGGSGPAVFSKEGIRFLSPLLAAALSKAQPEHLVVFRSVDVESSPPQVTAGSLYAHESMLYVTLTHFRDPVKKGDASKASLSLAPSSRIARHVLSFTPEGAGGLAKRLPPGAPDRPILTTLAVDVERLARLSESPVQHAGPDNVATKSKETAAGPSQPSKSPEQVTPAEMEAATQAYRVKLQELQDTNRLLGRRMAENRALLEDLRILREKLAEHRALIERLQGSQKKPR